MALLSHESADHWFILLLKVAEPDSGDGGTDLQAKPSVPRSKVVYRVCISLLAWRHHEMLSLHGPGVHTASQDTRLGRRALRALWPKEGSQFSSMAMGLGYKKLGAHLSGPFAERPHCLDIMDTVPGRPGHKTPGFANKGAGEATLSLLSLEHLLRSRTHTRSLTPSSRKLTFGCTGHPNPLIVHTGALTLRGTHLPSTSLFTHSICSPARQPVIYTHPCTH